MRKLTIATLALSIVFVLVMASSFANADLGVNLTVANPTINPYETQQITVTANEQGKGVVIVIQPAPGDGSAWDDYFEEHSLIAYIWSKAPVDVKEKIGDAIGDKILSFAYVDFGYGGGSETLDFADDFTGINGDPSTGLIGEYKVFFAYLSYQGFPFRCLESGFACGSWNVVPEVPLGTAAAAFSMIAAVGFVKYRKRLSIPKI